MPVKMTREQLEFWRELFAPFPSEALSVKSVGGRELTYIDKRSLANRLDSVVGPDGWFAEYRDAGGRGLICRLSIRVPAERGPSVWVAKEDGGSDEEMTKKQGGQQIKDVDNSFKSELTNAFRRAAQDAWGIGRYLYQKGIPLFLDPTIPAEAICGEHPAPAIRPDVPASPEFRGAEAPFPPSSAGQYQTPPGVAEMVAHTDREILKEMSARANAVAPVAVDRIDLPAAGRDVYAWVKNMEGRFRTSLIGGVKQGAESRGMNPTQLYAWPQDAVLEICGEAVAFIKTLASYRGEFEHITPNAPAPVAKPTEPPPATATAPPNTGDPLAAVKLELMTKIGKHIENQLGVKPNTAQLKAGFQTVAAECTTMTGHVGEVPDSLRDLADEFWIRNMIKLVDENLKKPPVVQPDAAEVEIPF